MDATHTIVIVGGGFAGTTLARALDARRAPGLQVTLISEALNQNVRLRISANALRSVEHRGGLDAFLAKADVADPRNPQGSLRIDLTKLTAAGYQFDTVRTQASGTPKAPKASAYFTKSGFFRSVAMTRPG